MLNADLVDDGFTFLKLFSADARPGDVSGHMIASQAVLMVGSSAAEREWKMTQLLRVALGPEDR